MGVSLTEALMGLGSCSVDFDWDADLYEELEPGRHLQFFDGERHFATVVITSRTPTPEGITITGLAPDWALGLDQEGPLIVDHEFVAGNDKLSDGTFVYGDLFWKLAGGSLWGIVAGGASLSGAPADDDALVPDDRFDVDPGQQFRATVETTRSSGALGRLRLRAIYDGRFTPSNLLPSLDEWTSGADVEVVVDPDDPAALAISVGPNEQPQILENPSFEDGPLSGWLVLANSGRPARSIIDNDPANAYDGDWVLKLNTWRRRAMENGDFETGDFTGWTQNPGAGEWTINATNREGNWAAQLDVAIAAGPSAMAAIIPLEEPTVPPRVALEDHHLIAVTTGEKWRVEGYAMRDPASPPDNEVWAELQFYNEADVARLSPSVVQSQHVGNNDPAGAWRWTVAEAAVPDPTPAGAFTSMASTIQCAAGTVGLVHFDSYRSERVEGNEEVVLSSARPVLAGEIYEFVVTARSGPDFISGGLFPRVVLSGTGKPDITVELSPISKTDNRWFTTSKDGIKVDDGYDTALVTLTARDIEGDLIYVDPADMFRIQGNVDEVTTTAVAVIPKRTYAFVADVEQGAGLSAGELAVVSRFNGVGRSELVVQSTPLKAGDAGKVLTAEFTPPSGYDSVLVAVRGTDVVGGRFLVRRPTLLDKDTATYVKEATPIEVAGLTVLDTTVPEGARQIRLELVAEAGDGGWGVTSMSLRRTGVTPTTVAFAVETLLTDLETGDPLLLAGQLHGSDVIAFDMRLRNAHNYQALVSVLRGGAATPVREWRVRPDLTVDIGTSEQIFAVASDDTGRPLVFTKDDIVVRSTPRRTEDIANRVTHIKVIGADRTNAAGETVTIAATAVVPGPVLLDAFGNPARRVRVIEDSTITHPSWAQLRADMEAELAADDAQPSALELASWRTKGEFDVGDWLHIFEPIAGLVDDTNEAEADDGSIVFPTSIRALQRTWKMADGQFDLKVRHANGSVFDVPHSSVRWEAKTTATVQVGKIRPTFSIDPQGGPALKQFVRFRSQNAA